MVDLDKAKAIINDYKTLEGGLIECLHAVQKYFGFVPKETINIIADTFNISRAEVHGVISYYHDFKTKPNGRRTVRVCQAEACQAMGSRDLSAYIKEKLGIDFGQSDKDGEYTLEAVYCFGNCALSPNIEIDGQLHCRVQAQQFDELLKENKHD